MAESSDRTGKKFMSGNKRLQSFLDGRESEETSKEAKPIADLFPYTTVLFGGKSCVRSGQDESRCERLFHF
jgi:hypothetical protein